MHKFYVLIVVAILSAFNSYSQGGQKIIIGIASFAASKTEYEEQAKELKSEIQAFLQTKKNITLLDKSKAGMVEKERDVQKNVEYLRGITVQQDKATGAAMLLSGTINSITAIKDKIGNVLNGVTDAVGNTSVSSQRYKLNYSLEITSVETGELVSSKVFNIDVPIELSVSTRDYSKDKDVYKDIIRKAKNNIDKTADEWINSVFPPAMKIISIDDRTKKGYPKMISILPDEGVSFTNGTMIAVNEILEINIEGKIKKKIVEVASIKVKERQGDFVSCEVMDGEKQLEEKMKSNLQLVVKSK